MSVHAICEKVSPSPAEVLQEIMGEIPIAAPLLVVFEDSNGTVQIRSSHLSVERACFLSIRLQKWLMNQGG